MNATRQIVKLIGGKKDGCTSFLGHTSERYIREMQRKHGGKLVVVEQRRTPGGRWVEDAG